jgi:hypothetical protein
VPRPLWEVPLIKAMFFSAMEAWDRTQLSRVTSSRTVSIPTHGVKTTNFALTKDEANDLYGWGEQAAATFFNDPAQQAYLNTFGETVGHTAVPAAAPA